MRVSVSFLSILLLATTDAALAGDAPARVWEFATKGKIYAAPVLVDLDGDGPLEVIIAASQERRLYCLDHGGRVRWAVDVHGKTPGGLQSTPSAADVDGDGKLEVFAVSRDGIVLCISSEGQIIWMQDLSDRMDYTGPVIADINGDGRIEIVFGSESGTLYCMDDAGAILWRYQSEGPIRGIPAVAYHSPSGTMRVFAMFGGGREACLTSDGDVAWYFDAPNPKKERWGNPAVGDVNGDGVLDVVTITDDFQVIARDAFSGTEAWRWKGEHRIDQTTSVALVDFDGTGRFDVVCADGSGQGGPGFVYRLRDGQPIWTADVGGSVVQGPSVGDVDGDGELEILVCSRSQRLLCLSATGQIEWTVPFSTEIITTPAIGDLDGDGTVEIVVSSKDRSVYCFTLGGAADDALMPWPMMNHDPQLSGNAAGAPFRGTAASSPAALPEVLTVADAAPLHLGVNVTEFSFANASAQPRRLLAVVEVERPDGSLLTHTVAGRREPYEITAGRFEWPADRGGDYHVRARLTDLGTGTVLAEARQDATLTPLDAEQTQLKRLDEETRSHLGRLVDGPLRSRAQAALETALRSAAESIAYASDNVNGDPDGEQDAALSAVKDSLQTLEHEVARLRAATGTANAAEFAAVPRTSLRKIFRDEPLLADSAASEAHVSLARNEYEGIQLAIVPLWMDLGNVRVTVSDLAHTDSKATIPATNIAVNRVGYVTIGPSEYTWYVEKQGDYPDVLFSNEPFDIPAGQDAQPYLITVHTAAGTAPGKYAGTIRVTADGASPFEMPLHVNVWDFTLSDETHLKTSLWMNEDQIASFYKLSDGLPFDLRKRWYDYHLDHRISPIKDFPLGGGDRIEDFEYMIDRGMNAFFLPLPGRLPEEKRPRFAERLLETEAILESKGWKDLAYLYTRDELSVMGRPEIPDAVEFSQWVHTIVPEIPRLQTSPPEHALLGVADVWCPLIDHFDPAMLKDRMAQGDRLWFYTVWGRPGIMIEFPATDYRIMFWQCWKYGAEGFLYWGTTHWALNMATDQRWPEIPWKPWNSQPGHNGCGYLLYPGPDGEPLGSLRFEIVRDGIEDYEYFWMLRDLVAKAGDALDKDLRSRVEKILAVDPSVVVDNKTFTDDPAALLDARAELAETIEAVSKTIKP